MRKILPLCLSLLFLSACAGGASINTELTPNSPYGLVVLGIKANPNDTWGSDINFTPYDVASKNLIRTPDRKQITFTAQRIRSDDEYYVMKFNPGTYILSSTKYLDDRPQEGSSLIQHKNDTIMFTVEPGKSIYIGDLSVDRARIEHADRNLEAARKKLARYPDVRGELVDVIPERASWIEN
jgi:hypothetical protein